MTLTQLIQIGVIPSVLVVLGGMLVRRMGGDRTTEGRILLFLLAAGIVLLLAVFVAGWLTPAQDNRPGFMVATLLAPVTLGVLTLVLIHLKGLATLGPGGKALAFLLGLVGLALLASIWAQPFGMVASIVPGALLLAVVWTLGRRFETLAAVLSLAVLALLSLCNVLTDGMLQPVFQNAPTWLRQPLGFFLFFAGPILAIILAAVLVSANFKQLSPSPEDGQPNAGRIIWWPAMWRLGLAALLVSGLAYTIVWASIWDQTSDGLGGIFLSTAAGLVAVAAGMVMGLKSNGWRRLAGLGFAATVPALMFAAFNYGWRVSYQSLTETRALSIQRAVERFHVRTGRYPAVLGELVPRELLWIPGPVILRGETWCYQGGPDYYRLGAFYREYFSTPLSLHVYASAGDPPAAGWACADRLAEMKARHDPPPMAAMVVPTQPPLPTSVAPMAKTIVQPLLRAGSLQMGNWSPGGQYLVFGVPKVSGNQSVMALYFLNAGTGQVCQVSAKDWAVTELRQHVAWLPDGRLLFISEAGEMVLFKPCAADIVDLAGRYPETFTLALSSDHASRRVLLRGNASYWILDAGTLQARPIAGVSPNPYELHWDQSAWSPDGGRLAISRLNGRGPKDGSALYLVAADTGAVEMSLPLEHAASQSAPWVEWLTPQNLLLSGASPLSIIDLRSDPARMISVFKDIFALDIADAYEISAEASVPDETGENYYLAVRVNHPRNQAVYVYHSQTGQVEVLQPAADALLFFPGGTWAEMPKMTAPHPDRDEYEVFWVDTPGKQTERLVVPGHLPRTYPALSLRYLPASSRLAFASSQGVSLVSLLEGTLLSFWELAGAGGSPSVYLLAPPTGETLVAVAEGVGLYYLTLP